MNPGKQSVRTCLNQGEDLTIETVDEGFLALAMMIVKQAEWDIQYGLRVGFIDADGRQLRRPVQSGLHTNRLIEDIHSLQAMCWMQSNRAAEMMRMISAAGNVRLHRDFFLRRIRRAAEELKKRKETV